jgi:hypothetical protein
LRTFILYTRRDAQRNVIDFLTGNGRARDILFKKVGR